MSQQSTQSYDFLFAGGGGGGGSRRRSRSRSRSPERSYSKVVAFAPRRLRLRRGLTMKGQVHRFTRVTATNVRLNNAATTTNYWAINNRSTNGISYGGTTPNVFGNQISFYFDLLAAHMDMYSDAGAPVVQITYNLPSVAEIISLYEEFRIDWVQIDCFVSSENAFRAGTQTDQAAYSPVLYYIKDYNDPDSTSLTQMMQHEDVSMWQPGVGNGSSYHRRIRVKPRANFTVANIDMEAKGTAKVPGLSWMTTEDSQTIPHYGVKMACNQFFPTGDVLNTPSLYLGFNFTYHLSCRNLK